MELKSELEFNELIKEGSVLVDFYSITCPPCRMLSPIIDKLTNEYEGKVKIAKVSVDNLSQIAVRYDIFSIPTLLFFKNGELVNTVVGYHNESDLKELISKYL